MTIRRAKPKNKAELKTYSRAFIAKAEASNAEQWRMFCLVESEVTETLATTTHTSAQRDDLLYKLEVLRKLCIQADRDLQAIKRYVPALVDRVEDDTQEGESK